MKGRRRRANIIAYGLHNPNNRTNERTRVRTKPNIPEQDRTQANAPVRLFACSPVRPLVISKRLVVIQWFIILCTIIEKIFVKILDKGGSEVLYLWLEFHSITILKGCCTVLVYLRNLLIYIQLYEYSYNSRCTGYSCA